MKTPRILIAHLFFVFLVGCVTTHKTPDEQVGAECGTPDACWAEVLKKHVNSKGQVNFSGIDKDSAALKVYVNYIARVSPFNTPEQFSDPKEKLAYFINSYNALAMWGVLVNDIPKGFDSFFKRLSFFKLNEYNIGGSYISLYDYENDFIRKVGDPRIHFALNCMSVGCPRLPQEIFSAENLDESLTAAAVEFFGSPLYLRIAHNEKTVYVSEILDFFTDDFVNPNQSPNLIEYINKYGPEKIPADYALKFIPYDWTVNKQ